jgi:hypothetical protein
LHYDYLLAFNYTAQIDKHWCQIYKKNRDEKKFIHYLDVTTCHYESCPQRPMAHKRRLPAATTFRLFSQL